MDTLLRTGHRRPATGLRRAPNAAPVRRTKGHRPATAASGVTGQPQPCGPGLVTDREAGHG
jgi:hypothetical protein